MNTEKYIVLLDNKEEKTLKTVEKEFQVKLTSSELLSSENKSYNIIDDSNGVLYKNLNMMVVDNMDEEQLQKAIDEKDNPIVHFEKERVFYVDNALDVLKEIQDTTATLQEKLKILASQIQQKSEPKTKDITSYEWGLNAIGLGKSQLTGKGINVCVLDTGFDISHADFVGRTIEGKSFIPNEDWDKDIKGHGTHCIGTAVGNLNINTGKRYGIAKNANLFVAKALANDGSGTTSSVVDAIDWAITKKMRIISMSLSSPVGINETPSAIFEAIGLKALENNCLLIAAAGNDSQRPGLPQPVSSPANAQSIMAVAAIDNQMRIANFSNGGINASTGGAINVCAPGVDVVSSFPINTYALKSGTSMATPHVAGMAALYMEKYPHLNAKEIWNLIEKNAQKIEGLMYRDIGSGLVRIVK
ncbi:MAG: S8 family serine peptidase [Bacteroidetes bacterium]|nr:S8 family serine peptidase [Bacteroidota bacterium]